MTSFRAALFRVPGPGGWTFVAVPAEHAPPPTHAWGRTPVLATVDGVSWPTSIWRDRTRGAVLAIPRRVRRAREDGAEVTVSIAPRVAT